MSSDLRNDPRFTFEATARQAAQELIDCIVWSSKSQADVPAVIEQIVTVMRDEWQQTEWGGYTDAFGEDPLNNVSRHTAAIDPFANRSPVSAADARDDESSPFLSLLSCQPDKGGDGTGTVDENPTQPFPPLPTRLDKDSE